ncbi:MAG TPA: hypothetical protein DCM05_10060 [Elusimicrobia bacterium]|nr:hypothetical protein [Elusimicrobiota bacterium]
MARRRLAASAGISALALTVFIMMPHADAAPASLVPEPTADELEVLKSTTEAGRRLGLHGRAKEELKASVADLQSSFADARNIKKRWAEFAVLTSSDILREESGALAAGLFRRLDGYQDNRKEEIRKWIIDALAEVGDEAMIPRLREVEKSGPLFYMGQATPDGPPDSILTDAGAAHNAILRIQGRARFLRAVRTKSMEELIDRLILDLKRVRYLEHESETKEVRARRFRLYSKELVQAFVRLGKPVVPRLAMLLNRHIEYREQQRQCIKLKGRAIVESCFAKTGSSHRDILGYEGGPLYHLIPEILAEIGDERAIPVLERALHYHQQHDPSSFKSTWKALNELKRK